MTPTLLLILDGWGLAAPTPGNAPYLAPTPNLDNLNARCPHAQLTASGRAVGLPEGYMGNSEVGHLNIGAGRVVYQDMTRIDVALEDGSFAANPVLNGLLETVKKSGGRLHLAGLLSDGGVHSHIRHLEAICDMAARAGVPVRVHCIMDGRDTDPKSGVGFARALEEHLKDQPLARIAGLVGRFYAMDRDKRWDRVKAAWDLLVHGQSAEGRVAPDAVKALEVSYAEGITDEFVKPVRCASGPLPGGAEEPVGMADGDALFFFNFRADRMRELTQAFIEPDFKGFERGTLPKLAGIGSMTSYEAHFGIPVAFPKEAVTMGLGEVVSRAGLRQLRLAETEKYAHVTYFFNGGVEEPFPGEDRILVPSPRDVPTYDLKPAMSARQVTDKFGPYRRAQGGGGGLCRGGRMRGAHAQSRGGAQRPHADHRGPRQLRGHADPRGATAHGAHYQSRALHSVGAGRRRHSSGRRQAGRCGPDPARALGHGALSAHDRPESGRQRGAAWLTRKTVP